MPSPSFLSGFETRREDDGGPQYRLACGTCGADGFSVFCYVHTVAHAGEPSGLNPGDAILLPPILLECGACRERQILFDPRRHGHDALLHGHCGYACERGELTQAGGLHLVRLALSYKDEPAARRNDAGAAGVPAEDLFDSIAIAAIPMDGGVPLIFEYACA
jgi:hypothetical protein